MDNIKPLLNAVSDPEFAETAVELSRFILEWNHAEFRYTVILSYFLGHENKSVAQMLGNQTRTDALSHLSKTRNLEPRVIELIDFLVRAFSLIKDNRNSLVHSYFVRRGIAGERWHWLRMAKSPRTRYIYCIAGHSDVAANADAATALEAFITKLYAYLDIKDEHKAHLSDADWGEIELLTLPEKFSLPDRLTPHAVPLTIKEPQPQSSPD